jgi:hypothetical protein
MDSLRIMRLEAGDTVVLQAKEELSQKARADVGARLRREFPDHKVLVLSGGWELSVIREGSTAAMHAPEGLTKAEYDRMADAWRDQHAGLRPSADPPDPPAEEFPANPLDIPPLPGQTLGKGWRW